MRPEHWIFTIPLRLRSLFRWAQADQELDHELRDHFERKSEEYVEQGMARAEARRRARRDLGGIGLLVLTRNSARGGATSGVRRSSGTGLCYVESGQPSIWRSLNKHLTGLLGSRAAKAVVAPFSS